MPFSDERSPVSSGTVPGERHIQEHLEITSSLQIVIRNKVEAEIDLIPTTSQKTNRLQSLWTVPFGGEENGSDRSATYCSAGTSPAKRTKGGTYPLIFSAKAHSVVADFGGSIFTPSLVTVAM
jgi:hypothetical protein